MSEHQRIPVYIYLLLLTSASACGILESDEDGGIFKVKPISAVEVALEVSGNPGDQIAISREGEEHYSYRLNQPDTVIYETGLQPATTYTWSLTKESSINGRALTARRQATTLDTTSSNFTWQTYSFGEHSSSVLYGVSIIDENNIWAVGEIYMNDSTGQADSDIYNAVHWDGENWELKRIPYYHEGRAFYAGIRSIHAFATDNIWFGVGNMIHWNGSEYVPINVSTDIFDSYINSIWGQSANSFYIAGNNGAMAHYNGKDWHKIEMGTELDFYDIHGNGKQGVVTVAAKQSQSSDKLILRINDDQTTKSLPTAPIPFSISGIWFDPSGVAYVVGSRISIKPSIDSSVPWKILNKEAIGHPYLFAIDANGLNDIVTAGGFGEIVHFNGATWTLYEQEIIGNLHDVGIKENMVVAVGLNGRQAFITIGKRE